jgi:DNA polymerase (family 10)
VAAALRELAALLELAGENPFKIRAYERGARAIEELGDGFEKVASENRLTEVEGIGEAIAQKATEFVSTGSFPALEKARAALPPGSLELSRLPGLGPKRARQLYDALDIKSLEELRQAAAAGRIRGLKGFGEKMEQSLLAAIGTHESRRSQMSLADALVEGQSILSYLRKSPAVERAELGGSLRRWKEIVGDLDVVVAASDWEAAADHFARYPPVAKVESRGKTKTTVRLSSGVQVDLRVVPADDFATAWHHFTGSKAHHSRLRGLAKARGLTLSEWGLTRVDGGEKLPIASEVQLYAALKLPYIPPRAARGSGRIRGRRGGRSLRGSGDARGPARAGARPHAVLGWQGDGRADGRDRRCPRHAVPDHHRPLTDGPLRQRRRRRSPASPVGRDRAGAGAGQGPAAARHGIGHPGRRGARLSGRDPGEARRPSSPASTSAIPWTRIR